MKVAIVGAGISGCLLADFLNAAGIDVSVFEKSRGCGGRASTKQTDFGQCDLGATVVPAQKATFVTFMQGLCDQDIASQWPEKIFVSQQINAIKQPLENFISDREHYVFNHKMNAPCRHWIKNATLHTNSLITQVRYLVGKGWQIQSNETWQTELFDKVVITAPWPQSIALIEQSNLPVKLPNFSPAWTSCWSIGLKLDQSVASDVEFVYLKDQSIQTLVRDSSKPKRPQVVASKTTDKSDIWVAQLANQLSDELGKPGQEQAIAIATKGLCELFELPYDSVSDTCAHYWRYAMPAVGNQPVGILSHAEQGVYVAGDWSFGDSIESAYETALTLSQSIITSG